MEDIEELYNRLSEIDDTFQSRYNREQFSQKMSEQDYVNKLSDWSKTYAPELTSQITLLKKKVGTSQEVATATLQEEATSSEPAWLGFDKKELDEKKTDNYVSDYLTSPGAQTSEDGSISVDEFASEDTLEANRKGEVLNATKRYQLGLKKGDSKFLYTPNEDPELEEIRRSIIEEEDERLKKAQKEQLEEATRVENIRNTRNLQSYLKARTEEELEGYLATDTEGVKEIKRERWREHQEVQDNYQSDVKRARAIADKSIISSITPGLMGMEEEEETCCLMRNRRLGSSPRKFI